jgi:4-hydroxybenzoate polyprenyltransferase
VSLDGSKAGDSSAMRTRVRQRRGTVRYSWPQVVHGYLVLPHAVPILVVMTATTAFALLASGGWPGLGTTFRLLGAMFGGQLAIGAINEIVDAELDSVAKSEKPIPSGLVTLRGAWIVTACGLVSMAVLASSFGAGPLVLCALGTGSGIAYSLWFKRTIWSWIPYLIALPLLPIWVWASLEAVDPALLAVYPIGVPAVIAVQIAQSLPDVEADRASGVRTLAVAMGRRRALFTCWALLSGAAVLASVIATSAVDRATFVIGAAGIAFALVTGNVVIWKRNVRRGEMACFPCIAAGAVVLGIGWAAGLVVT